MESMKDQNTIVLRAFTKSVGEENERVYNIIIGKIEAKKDKPSNTTQPTKMVELKKLGVLRTSGVLSEEEFQKEKENILNG